LLTPAEVMEGLYQLGLCDFASECTIDALRRHFESCVIGSGSASLPYTQLMLEIVGEDALPSLSPTDFAHQMYVQAPLFCDRSCIFMKIGQDLYSRTDHRWHTMSETVPVPSPSRRVVFCLHDVSL